MNSIGQTASHCHETRENVVDFGRARRMKAETSEGFTRLANDLLEQICKVEVSGRQFRVLMAIIRKTYGFQKKTDWIVAEQLAEVAGYEGGSTHIRADLRELKKRKIIIEDGRKIGVNPFVSEWILAKTSRPKTVSKQTENGLLNNKTKQTENGLGADRKRSPKQTENGLLNNKTKQTENGLGADRKRSPKQTENGLSGNRKRSAQKKKENIKETITKDSARVNRATQPPDNFEITDELSNWASDNQILVDLNFETEKFLDYHRARGNTFKNWISAWKNWMRNAKKFAEDRMTPPPVQPNSMSADWLRGNTPSVGLFDSTAHEAGGCIDAEYYEELPE